LRWSHLEKATINLFYDSESAPSSARSSNGNPGKDFKKGNLMSKMRAKMRVEFVQEHGNEYGIKTQEILKMHAVPAPKYQGDGVDEDNTYSKFTPIADLTIHVTNPKLFGEFKPGYTYYVDFSDVPTLSRELPPAVIGGRGVSRR
jgi:hypothetical protein